MAEKKWDPSVCRVSFDLDEVLFGSLKTHKVEPPLPFPFERLYTERLREGTPQLIQTLKSMGVEVWVYTSSYRTEKYIRKLFSHYNVYFTDIINAQRHQAEIQFGHNHILPQKLPNRYHIDLHIDDEKVIADYGKDYGFAVHLMEAPDDEWADKIIALVEEIIKTKEKKFNGN